METRQIQPGREDLTALAGRFGTDKWGTHFYTPHYDRHFGALRDEAVNLLEIGIGGYEDPAAGGESLRMWKAYFPRGRIFGLDLHDKRAHEEERVRVFQGSQTDEALLKQIKEEIGPLHIVVDDGSHVNGHVLHTFMMLFPLLEPGGIYAVEDLQTAYMPEYGGHPPGDPSRLTSINFLKDCVDRLNWAELTRFGYQPIPLDRQIVSMHFYHNLAFLVKGENNEPSNLYDLDGKWKG